MQRGQRREEEYGQALRFALFATLRETTLLRSRPRCVILRIAPSTPLGGVPAIDKTPREQAAQRKAKRI